MKRSRRALNFLRENRVICITTQQRSRSHPSNHNSNYGIVMKALTFNEATDIDYFITNVNPLTVTPEWIVNTYSQRNWVEVFYREAKG